jgi:hypothetical protein
MAICVYAAPILLPVEAAFAYPAFRVLTPETSGGLMAVDAREIERNWEQEEEADFIGFRLGMAITQRHGIPNQTYCWACYLLFYSLS